MKNTLFFAFIFLLFSCNNNTNTDAPAAAVSTTGSTAGYALMDVPNSSLQYAEKTDVNGILLEEGLFEGNNKTGTWTSYYPDKQLPKSQETYAGNVLNGLKIDYNNRGQIEAIIHYKNGQLHGRSATYKFGRILEETNYVNGQLDGLSRTYFNNSDKIQREVEFTNGKQNGFFRQYTEDGKMVMEYVYKNGEKVSGGMVEE